MASGDITLRRADGNRWMAALAGLRTAALDSLQTTLALLADQAYGTGTHIMLGSRWRLQLGEHEGIVFVRRSLQDRLDEAADLLGLRVVALWRELTGPSVRRLLTERGALYVLGEAYDMPWLPYAGHRRMVHSFLLDGSDGAYIAVDAYDNNTQWGWARPGAWALTADELDQVLAETAIVVVLRAEPSPPAVDPDVVLAENASRALAEGPEIDRYVEAVDAQLGAAAADQLALDVWRLGRERLLYAAWLARLSPYSAAAQEAARMAEAWQRLTTASYLSIRRAQQGIAMPRSVVEDVGARLRADAAFAIALRPRPAGDQR